MQIINKLKETLHLGGKKAAKWMPDHDYVTGDMVRYKGKTYRCTSDHRSGLTTAPTMALSSWEHVEKPRKTHHGVAGDDHSSSSSSSSSSHHHDGAGPSTPVV